MQDAVSLLEETQADLRASEAQNAKLRHQLACAQSDLRSVRAALVSVQGALPTAGAVIRETLCQVGGTNGHR